MLSTSHHGSVACECIALLSSCSSVPATALSTLPHISSHLALTASHFSGQNQAKNKNQRQYKSQA